MSRLLVSVRQLEERGLAVRLAEERYSDGQIIGGEACRYGH
jgi:hypothetical protein